MNINKTSITDSLIFANYIVGIQKVDLSNYSTWTSEIGLWLSGSSYKSYFTTIA